jgi:hypothetical protein
MESLFVRNLRPLPNEPAHIAQQIVTWYAGRVWNSVDISRLFTFSRIDCRLRYVRAQLEQRDGFSQDMRAAVHAGRAMLMVAAMTLTSGAILTIVVLHMLAN